MAETGACSTFAKRYAHQKSYYPILRDFYEYGLSKADLARKYGLRISDVFSIFDLYLRELITIYQTIHSVSYKRQAVQPAIPLPCGPGAAGGYPEPAQVTRFQNTRCVPSFGKDSRAFRSHLQAHPEEKSSLISQRAFFDYIADKMDRNKSTMPAKHTSAGIVLSSCYPNKTPDRIVRSILLYNNPDLLIWIILLGYGF